ncbi:hypothetical protein [Oceanobacillus caeni]|uniref:Short-chain dehydrogenase n=1 Tax=Oceanobacillus caeni TaxID=405946 RepID=A0ABR5MGP3_9BACI|nr:hypothetical protein [Oceanobacillus caeni]KPH71791.1 hypothetical protein AFL42_14120 [Oceanobacillus caeni]
MDLLLWITVGFIVIGFVVLFSMKKSMERRVTLIIENEKNIESEQVSNKPIIWWITGATVWGLVSMFLVVRSFSVYM